MSPAAVASAAGPQPQPNGQGGQGGQGESLDGMQMGRRRRRLAFGWSCPWMVVACGWGGAGAGGPLPVRRKSLLQFLAGALIGLAVGMALLTTTRYNITAILFSFFSFFVRSESALHCGVSPDKGNHDPVRRCIQDRDIWKSPYINACRVNSNTHLEILRQRITLNASKVSVL